jgi:mannosylglycerate hydrolase
MCGIDNKDSSLSVFTRSHKEFQVEPNENNVIKLTLLRTVSYLGKPDLARRPGIASGVSMKYYPAPESSLLNKDIKFNFAILFNNEKFNESKVKDKLESYLTDVITYNNQRLNKFSGNLKFFSVANIDNFPSNFKLIESINLSEGLSISNIEYKNDNKFIFRIHNVTNEEINNGGKIELTNINIIDVVETNLLSEPINNNILNEKSLIKIPSFKKEEIKTFLVRFK